MCGISSLRFLSTFYAKKGDKSQNTVQLFIFLKTFCDTTMFQNHTMIQHIIKFVKKIIVHEVSWLMSRNVKARSFCKKVYTYRGRSVHVYSFFLVFSYLSFSLAFVIRWLYGRVCYFINLFRFCPICLVVIHVISYLFVPSLPSLIEYLYVMWRFQMTSCACDGSSL